MHVVIIGGGITGLAAAFELAQRQIPFTLVEASSRLGGLIRTEHVDGFTIEAGPDSVLVQKPAALQLCEELGLGPRVISSTPPRTAYVLKEGRLHPLPSPSILGIPLTWRGLAGYDLLPPLARARLALEPLVRRVAAEEDESVASFFRRRFGPASVDLIAEPLLGGIHAGSIDALSIRSLFPRLAEAERRRGVLRTFRRTRPSAGVDGLFKSLSSGMGELVTAIEQRLPAGSVRLQSPVTSVARSATSWTIALDHEELAADGVILACPAHAAASLLTRVDHEAAALCATVPYVSTASVALAWPKAVIDHGLAGSGFVVARAHNALRITACTWVSSKWPGRAPAGQALLRVFVGSAADPEAVELGDEDLVELAAREVGGVLGISAPPALARVHRWRNAGAQHNVGQLARVAQLEARLSRLPGLFVAGSGFRSVGIPDCVSDGRAAAGAAAQHVRAAA
ncbi:MAG TPA: protoporphyrinogen oxidase [Vicinamibacterales bacterium]|nr:protoporphyrinogen oxidase [Vicinamibacterales bacterium]